MKIVLKLICITGFLLIPALTFGARDTYYVTQTGAGRHNGKSPASAWNVSDFNTSSNWSSTDHLGKVDPGDTVYFSGTITSRLQPQGSGTAGNYITLDGNSAQINVNVTGMGIGGCIHTVNKNYFRFQNLTINGQSATGGDSRAGICIASNSGSANHFVIDNCDITKSGNGIMLWGNVGYVTITNCNMHELAESGLWSIHKQGESDAPHHITFGGSFDNGNICANCGLHSGGLDVDSDVYVNDGDDVIISYNHLYSNLAGYGFSGIYANEARNFLVEYNTIHGHQAENHRNGITFKGDFRTRKEGYVIIRFNKIYNEITDGRQWGSASKGINCGYNIEYVYVYGNYIKNCGNGICLNISWTDEGHDGIDCTHLYVFSNIINETQDAAIRLQGPSGSTYDDLQNVYIFNNTIYRATVNPGQYDSVFNNDCAIYCNLTTGQTDNLYVKNNLIIDSRPSKSDYVGVYLHAQNDLYIDYNHYYHIGGTPAVHYVGSSRTPCKWNSGDRPAGYGANDTQGNPGLSIPANGDFTISSSDSPVVDTGTDMGSGTIGVVTIQGTPYPVKWDSALDPYATDWSTTPPTVVVKKQDNYGAGWERGAYVWTGNDDSGLLSPTRLRNVPSP